MAYLAHTDGYWQVWVMGPDGQTRQVSDTEYEKSRVSWFPDGASLLVNGNQGKVVRLDLASGQETVIPLPLKASTDAIVSPDGKRIAFSMSTGGSRDDNDIWVMQIDNAESKRLFRKAWLQHEPAWSIDGKSIYFLSGDGGQNHDIWQVELDDGALTQFTAGALYNFDVAPSPIGDLAFSSNRSGNYELWLLRAGESTAKKLTDHPALDARPAWTPDGKYITFESTRSGAVNLWHMDMESGELRQMTDHEDGARGATWVAK